MQKLQRMQIYLLITSMAVSAVIITMSAARGLAEKKGAAAVRHASMAEDAVGYVLGECDGHLALYRENSSKPYRILDMQVYLLSDADREAVSEGIVVKTEAELNRILQDWDSD